MSGLWSQFGAAVEQRATTAATSSGGVGTLTFSSAHGLRPGDIIVASSSGEFGDLPGFRASFERKPAQLVLNILRGRGTGRLLMQ